MCIYIRLILINNYFIIKLYHFKMTRFHTEYELKKQDKRLTNELLNNLESFKTELKDAINKDNHRSNVDRPKKKAVS